MDCAVQALTESRTYVWFTSWSFNFVDSLARGKVDLSKVASSFSGGKNQLKADIFHYSILKLFFACVSCVLIPVYIFRFQIFV